jgi:hypothetical protein
LGAGSNPSTEKQINSLFVKLFALISEATTRERTSTSSSLLGTYAFSLDGKLKPEESKNTPSSVTEAIFLKTKRRYISTL